VKTKGELLTDMCELEDELRRGQVDLNVAADELAKLIDEYATLGLGRSRENVINGELRATFVALILDYEPEDPYATGRSLAARMREGVLASFEAAHFLSLAINDLATLTATPVQRNEINGDVTSATVLQIGSLRPADGTSISRFLRNS
jgi:hypothetical protein